MQKEVDFIYKEIKEMDFANASTKIDHVPSSKDFGDIGWVNETLFLSISNILGKLKI